LPPKAESSGWNVPLFVTSLEKQTTTDILWLLRDGSLCSPNNKSLNVEENYDFNSRAQSFSKLLVDDAIWTKRLKLDLSTLSTSTQTDLAFEAQYKDSRLGFILGVFKMNSSDQTNFAPQLVNKFFNESKDLSYRVAVLLDSQESIDV
jgi:hypothetical protein